MPQPTPGAHRPPAQDAPGSWDELVRHHSRRVFRHAYRLTGDVHDAEDLTQDVFVRVFRALDTYTPGTFDGWLHRITTNLFLDRMRRRARVRFEALPADPERLVSPAPGPEEQAEQRGLTPQTAAALRSVAPLFREPVLLCDVGGYSYAEIAQRLGVGVGTVRSRIHRGRSALRAALATPDTPPPAAARPRVRAAGG